ncbi:MAG: FkbM family methyltransferase [Anaerolineae bacterium]|nr:FkbM family methyltransferase [Anaerolineae bacterium]
MFSFSELVNETPEIHIVDVGASPIEGQPIYQSILNQGHFHLTGFEPNPEMFNELTKIGDPRMTFLPYALGNGQEATLNICIMPGMSSILEPDLHFLSHFHGFAEWSQITQKLALQTKRLDDIGEINEIDFLKLDVQGSELTVLENAIEKLKSTLVIHVETLFVPFYKNQPLFGEIDIFLRKSGFLLHRFGPLITRVLKPLLLNNDIYASFSQLLWTDAVYIKSFPHFDLLTPRQLFKLARIMHDVYQSYDMAMLALSHIDIQTGSNLQNIYLQKLQGIKK